MNHRAVEIALPPFSLRVIMSLVVVHAFKVINNAVLNKCFIFILRPVLSQSFRKIIRGCYYLDLSIAQ